MLKSDLLLATTNRGKIREFQTLIGSRFQCLNPSDFDDKPIPQVEENGKTYSENALKKASEFHVVFDLPVLADDSGLEIDALGGKPGLHSARFGGEDLAWPERWKKVYESLSRFPQSEWTARFRCYLCYYDGKNPPLYFEGTCEGSIHPEPRGSQGFGYDPIFFSKLLGKTLGEASDEEKQSVSHRAEATRNFLKFPLPS